MPSRLTQPTDLAGEIGCLKPRLRSELGPGGELGSVRIMNTSARNRFDGTVTEIRSGAVNDEIDLTLPTGERIAAVITRASTEELGLRVGGPATALVKAPWIVLVTDSEGMRFSARNQFAGTVSGLTRGAVNTAVELRSGKLVLSVVVTNESADELALVPGVAATALFKASHVILATPA